MIAAAVYGTGALPAAAEMQFDEGRWRLELSGASGLYSGSENRRDDHLVTATAEYEFPVTKRTTLGLRLLPLFIYDQKESGEDTVWGAGAGLAFRVYQHANKQRGLFAEASANAIGHKNKFSANSSNLNFLESLGVGYQFKNNWHLSLRWQHISNASISSKNAGANSIALSAGISF